MSLIFIALFYESILTTKYTVHVHKGGQKHLSFEYSAGVMHLCRGCEAADFLCKALKIWMEVHCMWGYAPPKMKFWNLGSLRVCLLAIHISVSQGTN